MVYIKESARRETGLAIVTNGKITGLSPVEIIHLILTM